MTKNVVTTPGWWFFSGWLSPNEGICHISLIIASFWLWFPIFSPDFLMSTSMYRWFPIFSMDFLHGSLYFIVYVPYFSMIFTWMSHIFSHDVLMKMPWKAVDFHMDCQISQDQGFGVEAGIPTMVVAAAPLDDVLSIAGWMWADFLSFHQTHRKKTMFFILSGKR